jgi:CheY-like chemotaxis protein
MVHQVSQTPSPGAAVAAARAPLSIATKVLVLDDDESFRALARAILEPAGFNVLESASVQQCLMQLREQAVDAVVLDLVMPGRDGFEALRELKELFPEIRVVAVSGAIDSELYLTVSAHLGADASLDKSKISSLCPLLEVVLDR